MNCSVNARHGFVRTASVGFWRCRLLRQTISKWKEIIYGDIAVGSHSHSDLLGLIDIADCNPVILIKSRESLPSVPNLYILSI